MCHYPVTLFSCVFLQGSSFLVFVLVILFWTKVVFHYLNKTKIFQVFFQRSFKMSQDTSTVF